MRIVSVMSALLLASAVLTGCAPADGGNDDGQTPKAEQQKKPVFNEEKGSENWDTLQSNVPFPLRKPESLPHGMEFKWGLYTINPNNPDTIQGATLVFQSPDKKWALNVDQRPGSDAGSIAGENVRTTTVNGHPAQYVIHDKGSIMVWSDGEVIFAMSGSKMTEADLFAAARSFMP